FLSSSLRSAKPSIMTAFIKTCQTFGSFVSQATEATHSTNYPQHSSATNFTALRRALDYDTLFSKSATSFFQKPPSFSQTPHQPNSQQRCLSVSQPASIRRWLTGMQVPSDKKSLLTPDALCGFMAAASPWGFEAISEWP
ncbi:hypothetical protein, partial [uncultured Pseudacidovorax sp.]|uniref:hypothetical protein n=1 Tax=uncultured Pseudacidovorax sp. TaxID=679313 RepID=UPI0025FE95D0